MASILPVQVQCCFNPSSNSNSNLPGIVQMIANIAALRTVNGTSQPLAVLLGYTTTDDGGQGIFVWVPGSMGPDDNATLIVPTGGGGAWQKFGTFVTV